MSTKLYALLLEDVKKDADLLREILSDEGFDIEIDVVETEQDYVSNLKRHNYDIIFADFTLPSFDGQAALELAKKICPYVPFICISGTIGEDRAVELLKQGATDYVLKDRMERLAFATKRALDAAVQLNKFRQTEIELQTNRRLLQTIINNALDAIFIKDINGKYILINDASEKEIGKLASEVIGRDDSFIFPANEAQLMMEFDKSVIESGVPYTYEESITLADGKIHTFHIIKCPMFDDFGKPSGLFGIARDITERKHMEINLIEAKEKAEENDRLKTAFLHNISHEIRTPMNAIVGFSGFLNEPELEPEKRNYYIDIINQSCNQLLDIITDIVNISTLEVGQEKINLSNVNINAILKTLYNQFEAKAKLKNISINCTYHLTDNDSVVQTDQTKLTEILCNLIDNALKFTRHGHVNFGYKIVDALHATHLVEFYVEDTGIGIPPKMHDHIFERFRQVENSNSREFGGTGLGLTLSRGYVELLGGKIWLSSEPGKGSTFYFTLPFTQFHQSQPSETIPIKEGKFVINTSKTILVAEDEDYNFMFIEAILSDRNIKTIRAINGQEAIDQCKSNHIDLVLMDLKMPVLDGLEATRLIKASFPKLPVLAQTAYATVADKMKAMESGCDDYITKPYSRSLILGKISKLLAIKDKDTKTQV